MMRTGKKDRRVDLLLLLHFLNQNLLYPFRWMNKKNNQIPVGILVLDFLSCPKQILLCPWGWMNRKPTHILASSGYSFEILVLLLLSQWSQHFFSSPVLWKAVPLLLRGCCSGNFHILLTSNLEQPFSVKTLILITTE